MVKKDAKTYTETDPRTGKPVVLRANDQKLYEEHEMLQAKPVASSIIKVANPGNSIFRGARFFSSQPPKEIEEQLLKGQGVSENLPEDIS